MDPFEFLDHVSATAKKENPVPKNLLGYIDYDYDESRFPQELPRVVFDGQGLSHKGYSCLGDYYPEPGDRVVLLPVGTDFVILGSLNKAVLPPIVPGTICFYGRRNTPRSIDGGNYIGWDSMQNMYDFDLSHPSFAEDVTPTYEGHYLILASMSVDSASGISQGNLLSQIRKNRATMNEGGSTSRVYNSGVTISTDLHAISYFNGSTDSVQVYGSYTGGEIALADYSPTMQMIYLGPGPEGLRDRHFYE